MGDNGLLPLLQALMNPDNGVRSAAEAELARLKQSHGRDLLVGLVSLVSDESLALQTGMDWARSLGVILLKGITQREAYLWRHLSAEDFNAAKNRLLALLVKEPPLSRVGRLLIITLAALAKVAPWNELMTCVGEFATSGSEKEKTLAFLLLDKLAEYVGSYLVKHLDSVTNFICPALLEIDHLDFSNSDRGLLADKLSTMAAAAQACCSVIFEMDESALSNHQLCQHLLQAARVGRTLVDACESGVLDQYIDASSLAEDVLTSLNRLAQEVPHSFRLTFPAIATEVICPLCSKPGSDTVNLTGVKTQCVEMGTSLLVDPVTIETGLFGDATPTLRARLLQVVAHLATVVDFSEYGSEEEALTEFFCADVSGGSIFDEVSSEEDPDDNLTCLAISSLEAMASALPPEDLVQAVLMPVWGQVEAQEWRARRAVALLAGIMSEGAASIMGPMLPELLPKILALARDPHPRVRYTALRCVVSFIRHLSGENTGAEGEEDDNQQPSLRQAFNAVLPASLCATIEQNQGYPRIVHAAMLACRLYFDPDQCRAEMCNHNGDTTVVDFLRRHSVSLLRTHAPPPSGTGPGVAPGAGAGAGAGTPLYMLEEAASLLSNLYGTYFGSALRTAREQAPSASETRQATEELGLTVGLLRGIIGPLDPQAAAAATGQQSLGVSTMRCRCLEGLAIIGRSVGREMYRDTATSLLDDLSLAMAAGLDYSDPLSSYICQTAVRLAGLLVEEFEPYVTVTVPTILAFLESEEEYSVSLAEEGDPNGGDDATGASSGPTVKTETLYKRGEGMIRVTHNPHQVREKLMACRILYQYVCDIPMFLGPYAPRAVRALSALTKSLVFDAEGALVIGTAVSDLCAMYAEEKEAQGAGKEWDDQGYTLLNLVDSLLETLGDLSDNEDGGASEELSLEETLETLGNCLNTLAPLVV